MMQIISTIEKVRQFNKTRAGLSHDFNVMMTLFSLCCYFFFFFLVIYDWHFSFFPPVSSLWYSPGKLDSPTRWPLGPPWKTKSLWVASFFFFAQILIYSHNHAHFHTNCTPTEAVVCQVHYNVGCKICWVSCRKCRVLMVFEVDELGQWIVDFQSDLNDCIYRFTHDQTYKWIITCML